MVVFPLDFRDYSSGVLPALQRTAILCTEQIHAAALL